MSGMRCGLPSGLTVASQFVRPGSTLSRRSRADSHDVTADSSSVNGCSAMGARSVDIGAPLASALQVPGSPAQASPGYAPRCHGRPFPGHADRWYGVPGSWRDDDDEGPPLRRRGAPGRSVRRRPSGRPRSGRPADRRPSRGARADRRGVPCEAPTRRQRQGRGRRGRAAQPPHRPARGAASRESSADPRADDRRGRGGGRDPAAVDAAGPAVAPDGTRRPAAAARHTDRPHHALDRNTLFTDRLTAHYHQRWLAVESAHQLACRSGDTLVETRFKLLGHPVHPMLIVYPLGLLSAAVIFDVLYLATGNGDLATFSFWALAAGLVGGLAAALFGLIDWLGLPDGTRAKRIGALHGGGNLLVVALFAVSFLLRLNNPQYLPDTLPLIVGLLGAGVALVTAWLGGELVYRLRVAVDDDAGLNASSSLDRDGVVDVQT